LYSYGSHEDYEIVEDALSPFLHYKKPIDIVASFFQVSHLHGLLRRLDNSTMLCSVEARVPFVDHRLVERMAGVGFNYKMKDGVVKEPLKRVFSHILPKEIIDRKKVGFPVPLDDIFNTKEYGMDKWLDFNMRELLSRDI
jgi:asparagine synthase (glutamine-hydrolysing)